MDIKSKIMAFFGKFRNFNFLEVLLTRKEKKLLNEVIMNEELISYYDNKILNANKEIEYLTEKIEKLENKIKNIKKNITNITRIIL